MPRCQCQNKTNREINNSKDNMSPLVPRDPATVDPGKLIIAEVQDKDSI